jgi:hypothetical protein
MVNHGQLINLMTIGEPFEPIIDELKFKLGILPEQNATEHTYVMNDCTYSTKEDSNGLTILAKLDDAFAKNLGDESLGDLLSKNKASLYEDLMNIFGCVPKYLPLMTDGKPLCYP